MPQGLRTGLCHLSKFRQNDLSTYSWPNMAQLTHASPWVSGPTALPTRQVRQPFLGGDVRPLRPRTVCR